MVDAISVSPTCAVPVMEGAPVAGLLEAGAVTTESVAALVRVSSFSASSVKLTLTLMVSPTSSETNV